MSVVLLLVFGVSQGLVGWEEIPFPTTAACERARQAFDAQDQGRTYRICLTRESPR